MKKLPSIDLSDLVEYQKWWRKKTEGAITTRAHGIAKRRALRAGYDDAGASEWSKKAYAAAKVAYQKKVSGGR